MQRVFFILGALVVTFATGCYARGYGHTTASVAVGPPGPYVVHDSYRDGYTWVEGRWFWTGNQWQWREGYWIANRPGYVYMQGYWYENQGSWLFVDGRWAPLRPGYIWTRGYWVHHDHGRSRWVRGRWLQKRPGHHYSPGRYQRHPSGKRIWVPGRWSRQKETGSRTRMAPSRVAPRPSHRSRPSHPRSRRRHR